MKTTKNKLTWVPTSKVPVTLYEFDHLITKEKLEADDDFIDHLRPVTQVSMREGREEGCVLKWVEG